MGLVKRFGGPTPESEFVWIDKQRVKIKPLTPMNGPGKAAE
jgi:hypothetical protein